ncbi:MAG: class I SAM-dependent methyltransferase [Patescibacteria group bacterium]
MSIFTKRDRSLVNPVEIVRHFLHQRGVKSVLEIGCGEGGILEQMEGFPVREGIDWSGERLTAAWARNLENVAFKMGDITQLDTLYSPKQFDAVLAFDVLEHFEKDVSWKVLEMAENIASRYVVVWGPLGLEGMTEYTPAPEIDQKDMRHLCVLEEPEFVERGYFTMIFPSYWISWPANALLAFKKVGV